MKKLGKAAIGMAAVCLTVSLMGCGGSSGNGGNGETGSTAAGTVKETVKAAENQKKVSGEVYTISIGSISAETLPEVRAAYEFKQAIEEKSEGRIKVDVFANGQLGGDRQMVESVELGTLDITLVPTSVFTTYDERFGILDMPFVFTSAEQAFQAVDGELGDYLDQIMEEKSGMYNLGYMLNGVRHMVNGQKPINEPADLSGMKMRIMESPIYESMFKALGANPTPMSFGDVYTSLQQKVIDGFESSANFVYDMKFYEIQNHFSLTSHTISLMAVPINKAKYDSLPEDLRTILDECVKIYLIDGQRETTVSEDDMYMQKLKDEGMQINEVSPENHEKFLKAVEPMYEQYESEFGKEIFDLLRKYQ